MMQRKINGYTLIELLVVITIIGILASIIGFASGEIRQGGRDGERKSDLRNMQTAIEQYKLKYGRYPDKSGVRPVDLAPEFISVIPQDPRPGSGTGYVYDVNSDGTVYKLTARNTVESETVAADHEFYGCSAQICTSGCGGSSDYTKSYAVWGGYADGATDNEILTNTRTIVCN